MDRELLDDLEVDLCNLSRGHGNFLYVLVTLIYAAYCVINMIILNNIQVIFNLLCYITIVSKGVTYKNNTYTSKCLFL